jgi:hypothetical protein
LFSGDQLLVATDHETPDEVGRRVAEFPLDELTSGSGQASVRHEVVYRDPNGEERPATNEEESAVFKGIARMSERAEEEMPPCVRCGLKRAEHEGPLNPVRLTSEGPVYLACWTPEEREDDLPPSFEA